MRQVVEDRHVVHQAVEEAADAATAWWRDEERRGTLVGGETLWREAYHRHLALQRRVGGDAVAHAWPHLASRVVFERGKATRNERDVALAAAAVLADDEQGGGRRDDDGMGPGATRLAKRLGEMADAASVERAQLLALIRPAVGYPWMFPRPLWNAASVGESVHALLAPMLATIAAGLGREWFGDRAVAGDAVGLLHGLREWTDDGSDAARMIDACTRYVEKMDASRRDICVIETRSFLDGLLDHGLDRDELDRLRHDALALREAIVMVRSLRLYHTAEASLSAGRPATDDDDEVALATARRAANIYKRLAVAQQYPERVLARYGDVSRAIEEIRRETGADDERFDHVLLVSTFNSPGDLQRLLISIAHELMAFAYGRRVHVIVSDDSVGDVLDRNRRLVADMERAGMSISHWDLDRKEGLLDELNQRVFPDGSFDVRDLAGTRKPGEKGVPYGRFRNVLRLVALKEVGELGLNNPILTWLDQDNEIGALVLTKMGKLSKRHVFNYFEQKSALFEGDEALHVAGGGYTNDALEGVEKFWVAWGILHGAFALAQEHPPDGPPLLPVDADITRFRPWDQPDTLERLPREGEHVETLSDQVLLLLRTLLGTFRGKYDNQVQIYHPWTYGYVHANDEELLEETRAFAGMPGGNTTFNSEVLSSPIPFITVGGRGEDIFHLWQLESGLGVGSVRLTHTPALHSRNVSSGRSDLMVETIDSYNGRILREPPLLWSSLARLLGEDGPAMRPDGDVEADTEAQVDGLRNEAKGRIAEISGFASALEPLLQEGNERWWVTLARDDARFADVIGQLRAIVADFKDGERHQARADKRLLTTDDVRGLIDEFIEAYPHWRTVVEHVGGSPVTETSPAEVASVSPYPGYGARQRGAMATHAPPPRRQPAALVAELREPDNDPQWQEVYDSALALYRRYETGRAARDAYLDWPDRTARLRDIYARYASLLGKVPEMVWARLFRDALLIPWSPSYVALTRLLADDVWRLAPAERQAEVARIATETGGDAELLAMAVDASIVADESLPALDV